MAYDFAPDPYQSFKVGQEVGSSRFAGLGEFAKQVTERAKALDLLHAKAQYDVQSAGATETAKANAQVNAFKNLLGGQGGEGEGGTGLGGSDFMVESIDAGPFNLKSRSAMEQQAQIKGNVALEPQINNLQTGVQLAQKASQGLPQGQGPFGRRAESVYTNLTGGTENPDLRAYLQWSESNTVGIYKLLTGDTRLSNFDANKAKALTWRPDQGEPWEPVGRMKMERLESALAQRQSGGTSLDETASSEDDGIDWDQ